jgi:hypothetical protein
VEAPQGVAVVSLETGETPMTLHALAAGGARIVLADGRWAEVDADDRLVASTLVPDANDPTVYEELAAAFEGDDPDGGGGKADELACAKRRLMLACGTAIGLAAVSLIALGSGAGVLAALGLGAGLGVSVGACTFAASNLHAPCRG